jgi:hypothetical protein
MILGLCLLTAVVTGHVVMLWKALEERTVRWKLYELRDRLRFAAINDERILKSSLFSRVDTSLTVLAANLHDISLWLLVPLHFAYAESPEAEQRERDMKHALSSNENAVVAEISLEASKLFARHLACKHVLLSGAVIGTWFGKTKGKAFLKRVSQGVVLRVIKPPIAHPVVPGSSTRTAA